VLVDGSAEVTDRLLPTVGREVLPEDGVQNVSGYIESQGLLESYDGSELTVGPSVGELVESGVGPSYIGGVMLVMVEFQYLGRIVRLQGTEIVGEVGKRVLGHVKLLVVVVC
jgi:hypothetical protein